MNSCERENVLLKFFPYEPTPAKRRVKLNGKCFDLYGLFHGIHAMFNHFTRPLLTYEQYRQISDAYFDYCSTVDTTDASPFIQFLMEKILI